MLLDFLESYNLKISFPQFNHPVISSFSESAWITASYHLAYGITIAVHMLCNSWCSNGDVQSQIRTWPRQQSLMTAGFH